MCFVDDSTIVDQHLAVPLDFNNSIVFHSELWDVQQMIQFFSFCLMLLQKVLSNQRLCLVLSHQI